MKRTNLNALWGVLLIVAGILALGQTLNIIGTQDMWGALWGIVFAIAGLGFMWMFLRDQPESWWAVIPGLTLLALAALVAAGLLGLADANGPWLGAMFLWAIGLSFLVVYLTARDRWWAIIPAGVLLTVGAVAGLSMVITGVALGSVMFFGMALTFVVVYALPTPQGRMTWALVPAGILALMGVMTNFASASGLNTISAVALILAGLYVIYRQRGGLTRHG